MIKQKNKIDYSEVEKMITVRTNTEEYVSLSAKLEYEGMPRNEFIRAIIQGYIDDDKDIVKYIRGYKERQDIQTKENRRKVNKYQRRANKIDSQFTLSQDEVRSLFDFFEEEQG